jgi:hypothetical protein
MEYQLRLCGDFSQLLGGILHAFELQGEVEETDGIQEDFNDR